VSSGGHGPGGLVAVVVVAVLELQPLEHLVAGVVLVAAVLGPGTGLTVADLIEAECFRLAGGDGQEPVDGIVEVLLHLVGGLAVPVADLVVGVGEGGDGGAAGTMAKVGEPAGSVVCVSGGDAVGVAKRGAATGGVVAVGKGPGLGGDGCEATAGVVGVG